MPAPYDRSKQDLGNSVGLEHVNTTVPDPLLATLFYVSGLGLTRDPYLMTGLENMWINVGRSQFHLPTGQPQVLRGHTGLIIPGRDPLLRRLGKVKDRLAATRFSYTAHEAWVDTVSPWGNRIRVYEPDAAQFGNVALGMPYVEFDVPRGTAAGIAGFYREAIGTPAATMEDKSGRYTRVLVGIGQHLVFREHDGALPDYDGHHLQIYIADFSGPHRWLSERGLVTQESNAWQYRFRDIVDPQNGKVLYVLEHEVRSLTHPLFARPLVNRDPAQSNNDYAPGYDSASWAAGRAYPTT
jgi:hypothetical protein